MNRVYASQIPQKLIISDTVSYHLKPATGIENWMIRYLFNRT